LNKKVAVRVLCGLLFIGIVPAFATDPKELIQRIGDRVAEQVSKTANYTCLETLERSYYRNNGFEMAMYGPSAVAVPKNELLYDRLKLDVAVSEGSEIYAWHGSNKFGANEVTDVVQHGPISTGQFIGYLKNLFLVPGVRFTYRGPASVDGNQVYQFDFDVPQESSRYSVQTKAGQARVPYHGSLTARASDLQMNSVRVLADNVPFDSRIRSATMSMTYQAANMGGRDALIPASFVMQLEDAEHIFTVSHGEYSECREYAPESNVHFADVQSPATSSESSRTAPQARELPPGLKLNVELTTDVNDQTAYTGNPIEGVLVDRIERPGLVLPKGARLTGVITMFQVRFVPQRHYFVKVEFQHVTAANTEYSLRSVHQPSGREAEDLFYLYGGYIPEGVSGQLRNGVIVFDSRHVKLHRGFRGVWQTLGEPKLTASTNSR
jgi:hypothetical protein